MSDVEVFAVWVVERRERVERPDVTTPCQKGFAQMASYETGGPCDENTGHGFPEMVLRVNVGHTARRQSEDILRVLRLVLKVELTSGVFTMTRCAYPR